MIPLVIAGVGALIGGGVTFFFSENEKQELRDQVLRLEEQQERMAAQIRAAATREVKQRKEILRLTLEWSRSRYATLLAANDASFVQLERVWSVGKALQRITAALPDDGVLAPDDKTFVDIVVKAQSGNKITRVDQAHLEDYLDAKVGDQRRDFLEDRLSNTIKRDKKRMGALTRDRENLRIQRDAAVRVKAHGGTATTTAAVYASRLQACEFELEETRRRIENIEQCLVVLTRVSRPEEAQTEDDQTALDIVKLLASGESLTDAERDFIVYYRDRHFRAARDILRARRGIDIAVAVEAN